MSEGNLNNNLEREIADLSRQIEAKRQQLEQEKGILIEDREAVSEVIKDQIISSAETAPVSQTTPASSATSSDQSDYLDTLDEETVEMINSLVGRLPELGLVKTIELARSMNPFYLDVYHDALVNKLYEELVAKGFLNK